MTAGNRPGGGGCGQIGDTLSARSTRQIDLRLGAFKVGHKQRAYGGPGRLLKHHVPFKVDRWDARVPGFTEVNLVAHSENSGGGEFAYTLNVTDACGLAAGVGTRARRGRARARGDRPGPALSLLGIDTDSGSEFLNWPMGHWCARRQIQFTRGRHYKKDNDPHIEQKIGPTCAS